MHIITEGGNERRCQAQACVDSDTNAHSLFCVIIEVIELLETVNKLPHIEKLEINVVTRSMQFITS